MAEGKGCIAKEEKVEYDAPAPQVMRAIEDIPVPPPLSTAAKERVFDMPPSLGGPTKVELLLSGRFGTARTPLALVPLVDLDDETVAMSPHAASEADAKNLTLHQHNIYVAAVINEFCKAFKCRTSGCTVTLPELPRDYASERKTAIDRLRANSDALALRAIQYLAGMGRYPVKDYPMSGAVIAADAAAMEVAIAGAQKRGRVRVRSERCPPSWWDGRSSFDSAGNIVGWKRTPAHLFLSPDVVPVILATAAEREDEERRARRLCIGGAAPCPVPCIEDVLPPSRRDAGHKDVAPVQEDAKAEIDAKPV